MPESERRQDEPRALRVFPLPEARPILDAAMRRRLGCALQALYDPVIDEPLDPRLADLLRQLDADRAGAA